MVRGEKMGNNSLEYKIGDILTKNNISISTAESCTGGLLAGIIINYPGISKSFNEGFITYSNEAKMKRLGVKEDTLEKYGAVSKETAKEMAEGVAKATNSSIGISTTGLAGPDGETANKKIGLVYVGLYINGISKYMELNLHGDRQEVRNKTVEEALKFLILEFKNKKLN